MAANYCQHCGAKLSEGAKFCTKCGREVRATIGKLKPRINRGVFFFILSIIFSFLGGFVLSVDPKGGGAAAVIFFLGAGILYLAALLEFFRWLFRKNKKVGFAVLILIIVISSFSVVYYQSKQAYLSEISEILDIGAEVAYAKSVGDDLIASREVLTNELSQKDIFAVFAQGQLTSMAPVYAKLAKGQEKIKGKKVKAEIEPFRNSVETWAQTVLDASNFKNPEKPTQEEKKRFQNLPKSPSVVSINFQSGQQVSALDSVAYQIKQLQEKGDLAIAGEDRSAMRLVYARAMMSANFVDSLSATNPNICSKRGCVPEVKSFVAGVQRSAHNYVVGDQGAAAADWDKTWGKPPEIISGAGAPLGGLGITQGSPDPTPPPNKPTKLVSMSPDYKPRTGAPPWDGTYSGSANVSCDTESSDFADSFADSAFANFEVRGGKILGGAVEIAIDSSGHASYNTSVAGFNVTSDYYFTQTGGGGAAVSGNFSLYGEEEGISMSCSGSFDGSRIEL